MTNTEYKKGDRVLVTLSGVEVPAVVDYTSGKHLGAVDVKWTDGEATNAVYKTRVRLDPEFAHKVEVGTVLRNVTELRAITNQCIVLVDQVDVAGTWSGTRIAWAVEDNSGTETDAHSVVFPATIVAVL